MRERTCSFPVNTVVFYHIQQTFTTGLLSCNAHTQTCTLHTVHCNFVVWLYYICICMYYGSSLIAKAAATLPDIQMH